MDTFDAYNYQTQNQLQLHSNIKFQDEMINHNNEEITKILKDQIFINEMFKDISLIVSSSSPLVDNIETNIMSSSKDIEYGNKQIEIAEKNQKSQQKNLCYCVIGIAIIIIILLVIILRFNHLSN